MTPLVSVLLLSVQVSFNWCQFLRLGDDSSENSDETDEDFKPGEESDVAEEYDSNVATSDSDASGGSSKAKSKSKKKESGSGSGSDSEAKSTPKKKEKKEKEKKKKKESKKDVSGVNTYFPPWCDETVEI